MIFSFYSETELAQRCAQARAELLGSSEGRLNFRQVMSVLSVYGKKPNEYGESYALGASDEEKALALQGRQRRRWNALLCGEKILHLWSFDLLKEHLSPTQANKLRHLDLSVHLRQAKQAVLLDEEFAVVEFDPSPDELNYSLNTAQEASIDVDRAVSTHLCIWSILFIAGADEFNIFDLALQYPEEWHGDYMEKPSALRASYAFDGRPLRDPAHPLDPRRSLEFWLWWIDEAVPASWHLQDL